MNVVVVESPAKAKTINKYLGKDYTVLASYGHVRDLPPKDGSVRPSDGFAMEWQIGDRAEKPIKAITDALVGAKTLYLATDPDREGEAISWHIEQILRERKLLDQVDVKRVVFHEITESAIRAAFEHPRDLDRGQIEAYLARRALDYLVGFTLSPVLWRKLPGSRSAGRVQSVALRLICERESEIEIFKPREYWSIIADMATQRGEQFNARLTHLDGTKLDRFTIGGEAAAMAATAKIEAQTFGVEKIEKSRVRRNPYAPFTTSTLQQEASRKLGFGATQTMRVAQRLYEGTEIDGETVGLISYMRTDSVTLSADALSSARDEIDRQFGAEYLPPKARVFKTKAKNAQEAHEAIRPTDLHRRPDMLVSRLDRDQFKLYELIWKRTIASQMAEAQIDKVKADLKSADGQIILRANGSTTAFDGFLRVYQEDRDDVPAKNGDRQDDDDSDNRLPPLAEGEAAEKKSVSPNQHFTQPPPRFTEASLVKRLEELGIGRPSTYASILQVLQDRDYVVLDKKRFVPEDRGRIVTSFLESFFHRYVEYDFTADLEDQLDKISNGDIPWLTVMNNFWDAFSAAVDETKDLRTREVLDALNEELAPHFFPGGEDGAPARRCPACEGELSLKLGRHGPFVGCSRYPECRFTRRLAAGDGDDEADADLAAGPKLLGTDPETGIDITLRKGPYGIYVQLGEAELDDKGKAKSKPKRSGVPKGISSTDVDLAMAIKLLSLPREVGAHPEDGKIVQAGLGRFGPYVKHGSVYASLTDPQELFSVGLNRAVTLLAEKKASRGRNAAKILHEIGLHPEDETPVNIYDGRYGPYIKHGKVNATVPRDMDPETVTMERALDLLRVSAEKKKAKSGGKKNAAPKKKTTAKKKAGAKKKPAAKKTTKAKKKTADTEAAAG